LVFRAPLTVLAPQLATLTDGSLERPFALVEDKLRQISAYVNKWLQFQSLWDLESEYVYSRLGDSLSSWQQLLLEIRKTRSTFDNSETQRSFGVAVINYEQVQSKVNAKYDTWQRDILGRFGSKLSLTMKETHAAILKARHDLEHHSIEGSSTAATVTFITFVQDLKRKVKKWTPEIEIFGSGQKTLERQRYQFPQDWLYVDQIEGEWSAFNEILTRKNASIQDQLGESQFCLFPLVSPRSRSDLLVARSLQPDSNSRSSPKTRSCRTAFRRSSSTGRPTSRSRARSRRTRR
jgi:dynein heavy chain 1